MADDVVHLISWWLYDVDRFLRNRLESLKEDLVSSDESTRRMASGDAESILDWLSTPDASLSDSERLERVLRITQADEISPEQKLAAAARAIRSSGRRRG